jgi:hypothetical protein
VLDVLIKQCIHLAAILVWRIPESEEVPNLLQRHVQRTAVPNKLKAFDVNVRKEPVVSFGTSRLKQQSLPLVIPNCFHETTCSLG